MTLLKKKIRPTRKEKLLKTALIIAILIIVALIILGINIILSGHEDPSKTVIIFQDLIYALFTTIISVIIVTIAYTFYTEIDFKNKIEQSILDSLSGDKTIISKYKHPDIIPLAKNCLTVVQGERLSGHFFCNILDKYTANVAFRSEYEYSVKIMQDANPDSYKISQSIAYRKHIKKSSRKKIKSFMCILFQRGCIRSAGPHWQCSFFQGRDHLKDTFR